MNRSSVAALHAALLLGTASVAAAASTPAGPAASAFNPPPNQPMLLSRTLRRDLADGKAIITTRRYRIRFIPTASGWRVEGELLGCEVDAPAGLAPLAEIERRRPDNGLFPLNLDRAGTIVAGPETDGAGDQGRESVDRAVTAARARLEARPPGPLLDAPITAFLQQIQGLAAQAATSRWPATLFVPGAANRDERRFALPDGGEGTVTAEVRSTGTLDAARMVHATREIVTVIAGNRRVSREDWSIGPLGDTAP